MGSKLSLLLIVGVVIGIGVGAALVLSPDVSTSSSDTGSQQATITPTPIPTATSSPSGDAQPRVESVSQTDDSGGLTQAEQLRRALRTEINRYRTARGLDPIQTDSRHGTELTAMATVHSQMMARTGTVDHTIRGNTTADRYEAYGLYEDCTFNNNNNAALLRPEFGTTELIANPIFVAPYQNPAADGYDGNALRVARMTVNGWANETENSRKLSYRNPEQMGIGVVVTDRQSVYVAVAMCGE